VDETIIVQVGGEGGAITLFGRRENGQWQFRRSSSDSSWAMIDEEVDSSPQPAPDPTWVKTWSEAIALLDRSPWANLVPISVHADFREEVLFEVTRRLLAEPSSRNERQMERWLSVCKIQDGISTKGEEF
jgi:hypothetical protein